eukprot:Nk52_evm3s300 gene=Nk52_evmTU3s300
MLTVNSCPSLLHERHLNFHYEADMFICWLLFIRNAPPAAREVRSKGAIRVVDGILEMEDSSEFYFGELVDSRVPSGSSYIKIGYKVRRLKSFIRDSRNDSNSLFKGKTLEYWRIKVCGVLLPQRYFERSKCLKRQKLI